MKMTEEEVKLNFIAPAIESAGWSKNQIRMEYSIDAGKIIARGEVLQSAFRKRKRIMFFFYKENLPLAIVEAKDNSHLIGDGMFQAQEYAVKLGVRFAFTSNGDGFLFYDMETAEQKRIKLDGFPSPDSLYDKQCKSEVDNDANYKKILETPYYYSEETHAPGNYQRIAINVEFIAKGNKRALLVMATGTGKTHMAFQIIYRLWKSGIKKKTLYLADRNILADQTIIGDFKPFKNSMTKISHKRWIPHMRYIYHSISN